MATRATPATERTLKQNIGLSLAEKPWTSSWYWYRFV